MATYRELMGYSLINAVDGDKVNKIAGSIMENGWVGCPILFTNGELITGSHRLAALRKLENEWDDFDEDIVCAEDVTDLVNDAFTRFEEENGYAPYLDLGNIGWMFEGTWVADYKNEIEEW